MRLRVRGVQAVCLVLAVVVALLAADLSAVVAAPVMGVVAAPVDAPLASAEPVAEPLTTEAGDFSSPPPTVSELEAMYSSPLDALPADGATSGPFHGPPSLPAVKAPLPASVPRNACGTTLPRVDSAAAQASTKRDAALLRACARGKDGFDEKTSRRVDGLTSPTEEVFENADGSRTSRVSPSPVRFKDVAGVWQPIDLSLVAGKDGLTTKSSELPVTVPSDPVQGLAVIATPSGEIRLSSPGLAKGLAAPAVPETVDARVAPRAAQVAESKPVAGAAAGRSVRVTPRADGFEQDTILADASAGSSYVVDLSLPKGASARSSVFGVDLVGADGVVFAQFGGGVASDAKVNPNSGLGAETAVSTKLLGVEGSVAHVEVSIDPAWLADPARVFPVTIDPLLTYTLSSSTWGTKDTFTQYGWTTPQYASTELRLGSYDDGFGNTTGYAYSLLHFPLDAIKGDDVTVTEAHLTMYNFWSSTCDASVPIQTEGIGSDWDQATVTYATLPYDDGLGVRSSAQFAKGNSGSCPADWVSIDATSLANQWAHTFLGVANNKGMYLQAADMNDVRSWRRFYSGESGFWSAPYLQVTYTHTPTVPTLTAPLNESTVASTTPTLSWSQSTDADGDPINYTVRVSTGSDAESGTIVYDSGSRPASAGTSLTVPDGQLRDGETYYWHVWAGDLYGWTTPLTAQKFTVNTRMGSGQPSPYDSFGPASVNLATGNLVVQTASPQYSTVGGGVGLNYSYNSLEPSRAGLTVSYYAGVNTNGNYVQRRVESVIDNDWSTGAAVPGGLAPDNWSAVWTGYITVPYTGTWYFGTINDDGAQVFVDDLTTPKVDFWTDGGHYGWGAPVTLTANQPYPIKVRYYDNTGTAVMKLWATHAGFAAGPVPANWLTTDAPALPKGWQVSLGGTVNYQHVTPGWGFVLVEAVDGSKTMFVQTGNGFVPVIGQGGMLARDVNGVWWFLPGDGLFYMFDNASGNLLKVYQANDGTQTAAAEFTWAAGSPPRVTSITDPVSQRSINLVYGGDAGCPTPPPGFDGAAPEKALCKVNYWDGNSTSLFYVSPSSDVHYLARLVDPGGETTDFGYDANGRVVTIRDPLAYDAVFAGSNPSPRANDSTTLTTVTYEAAPSKRVASIQLPAPLASDTTQPKHTYSYNVTSNGSGTATVATLGVTNTSSVTFDDRARATASTDTAGLTSTTTWSPVKDLALRSVGPTGMETSTVYDHADRPTDTYGPAPAAMFDANGVPIDSAVPHSVTRYDEGMNSLSVAYYSNTQLAGPPVNHTLGIGDPSGAINHAWNGASPAPGIGGQNWSARLTGDLTLPTYGWYTMSLWAGDGVRMWIDDKLVIDSWFNGPGLRTGAYANAEPAKPHRVRIEYWQGANNNSNLLLLQTDPNNVGSVVAGSQLGPRYGLVTSSTDPDGKTAASTFTEPWAALTASTRVDPAGLNLTTSYTYEVADTTHFRRQLTKTLPAGNTWSYSYYGNTATASQSTCAGTNVKQGGALKTRTGPAPAGGSSRVEEFAYDQAGKPLGSRIGSDPWTCLTYDARQRVATKAIPAFGGEPARTVTYNYSVGGNPLVGSVSDPTGTITTTVDLLGRARSTTDVWGKTITTTYDVAGRVTTTVGPRPTDAVTNTYDPAIGRLTSIAVDGATTANVFYDAVGRVDHYEYPNGAGNNGNGTKVAAPLRDNLDRVKTLTWQTTAGATITSDEVARTTSGVVTDEVIDSIDADPTNPNFVYDTAGRLTTARVAGHTYQYGFGTPSGCGTGSVANAGANTNRTSVTDTPTGGSPTTTYSCYDAADKLISTPVYPNLSYDAHGNTTALGAESLGYDGADRHMVSTTGTTQVRYTRDASDAIVGRTVATVTPPSSGIAFRAQTSNNNGANGANSLQLSRPAGVQTGDALIAVVAISGTPTVTPPSGWSQIATVTNDNKPTTKTYVHVAAAGDPATWTWTFSTAKAAVGGIVAYSGTDPANPIDTSATGTSGTKEDGTTSQVAPSVTSGVANEELVGVYAMKANTTTTPAGGTTERIDAQSPATTGAISFETADQTIATAGATGTRTATTTVSTASANQAILLRPDPGNITITQTDRYTAGATLDGAGNVIERTFGLPGGVSVTKRTAGQVWSYPNIHGDVVAVADQNGTKQGATYTYDPYGNSLNGQVPDNKDGNLDTGWIGARATEHETGLAPIIEMGARQYDSRLGRFLEVDPVPGGSCNDYDYVCADPINGRDLDGRCGCVDAIIAVAALEAYLRAISAPNAVYTAFPPGMPPVPGMHRHHIVARGATNKFALATRTILEKSGIEIDSSINLAYMSAGEHQMIHTGDYYRLLYNVLNDAGSSGGPAAVRARLNGIRLGLELEFATPSAMAYAGLDFKMRAQFVIWNSPSAPIDIIGMGFPQ